MREQDIAIDFKAGSAQFIVGPGSIRPDGKVYIPGDDLASADLPIFLDRKPPPQASTGKVPKGQRNLALYRRALEFAPIAEDFDGLTTDLRALRDIEFEDAASVPDSEIIKVAEWAWRLRLEGRIWAGRNSVVQINRLALDLLLPLRDGADAIALYSLLVANHGHMPGKVFSIVPDAMVKAKLLGMGRSQIYRARDILLREGLLTMVRKGRLKQPHEYRLQSPAVAAALRGGERVFSLHSSSWRDTEQETAAA